jgi:transposase
MPYSSSVTDEEWEIIEPLFPKKKQTRMLRSSRRVIAEVDQAANFRWSVLSTEERL